MQLAEARPHHQQHAGEAGDDGRPAPRPDALAQHHHRQHRDEQRREEDQRIGLGQRDGGEGIDAAEAGDHAGRRAHLDHPGPLHAPEVAPALLARPRQDDRQGREAGDEEDDLEDRQLAAERLGEPVAPCPYGIGQQSQQDRLRHASEPRKDAAHDARAALALRRVPQPRQWAHPPCARTDGRTQDAPPQGCVAPCRAGTAGR